MTEHDNIRAGSCRAAPLFRSMRRFTGGPAIGLVVALALVAMPPTMAGAEPDQVEELRPLTVVPPAGGSTAPAPPRTLSSSRPPAARPLPQPEIIPHAPNRPDAGQGAGAGASAAFRVLKLSEEELIALEQARKTVESCQKQPALAPRPECMRVHRRDPAIFGPFVLDRAVNLLPLHLVAIPLLRPGKGLRIYLVDTESGKQHDVPAEHFLSVRGVLALFAEDLHPFRYQWQEEGEQVLLYRQLNAGTTSSPTPGPSPSQPVSSSIAAVIARTEQGLGKDWAVTLYTFKNSKFAESTAFAPPFSTAQEARRWTEFVLRVQ